MMGSPCDAILRFRFLQNKLESTMPLVREVYFELSSCKLD